MTSEIVIGSIVVAKRASDVCFAGELGVCFTVYESEGRSGYGFIFETGRYDGFTPDDVEGFLNVTGRIFEAVANYQFTNVRQLKADFRAGRFAAAFPAPMGRA
jgi:hypothetical protein